MQAHLQDGRVTLYSRNALHWTARLPTVADDVAQLPARALVLDGEVVSAADSGRANFAQLQDDLKHKRYDRLCYYAFDLLHLDGFDVRAAPLIERKRVLQAFLAEANGRAARVLYTEHFEDGAALYEAVCALGLEGVVSKRADAPYRSGRTESWLKTKCLRRERFVVVGFAPESGGGIAKLRLARRDGGALVYVGRVGTGWSRKDAVEIRQALTPLTRPACPLLKPIRRADTVWVQPHYEAEVAYTEVTSDGMLRLPSFKGLVSDSGRG
jgi:bifunctional non-homologous end joining protein LigD